MDLPCTESGNKHVVVFQDMFNKWPMVYAVPDQKTERITKLLRKKVWYAVGQAPSWSPVGLLQHPLPRHYWQEAVFSTVWVGL